ncbi:unnamed protein product [Calypogeia fissa]
MGTQLFWPDIEHAERCLVSAMYEEAAEVASSTLRILTRDAWSQAWSQTEPSRQRDECAEVVSMVESAGMVLLQAVNQMDRPCNIFRDLISIFDGVGKVPFSLILTGTCLQLSTGFHPASQKAIEEYLNGWRSIEGSSDGLMARVVEFPDNKSLNDKSSINEVDSNGAAHTVYLSRTNYVQLTEIYAVEVLAKLHKNYLAAHMWIQNSNISEEEKKIILQRLQQVSQPQKPSPSNTTSQKHETNPKVVGEAAKRTREENDGFRSLEHGASTSVESSESAGVPLTAASDESKSRVVRGSGIWRLPFVITVMRLVELVIIRLRLTAGCKWIATRRRLPQSNLLFTGAFASVIVYAMLRNRHLLRRRMTEMAQFSSVCFSDLWRLAFSVHLNPLAAV